MLKGYGVEISPLSNHADSLLILGPHTEDTDKLCPGTRKRKEGTA
jgi:Ni,Fe-hydrogenase III small subunit